MKVVIIGAGTCAISVADMLVQDRNFRLAGFIGTAQEAREQKGRMLYGNIPLIGDRRILKDLSKDNIVGFVAAIGDNNNREKAYYDATRVGLTPINVVSRHAVIEPSVSVGKGVIIYAGCIIFHGVTIGNNTIVESGVTVGINATIGENCLFDSGYIVGGECVIGRNVTFGLQSATASYLKIGKHQTVAPRTYIKKSLPDLIRNRFDR